MDCLSSAPDRSKYYRDLIKNSIPPLLPYLGQFLTDLTMIEDGNPDCAQIPMGGGADGPDVEQTLVNVHKLRLLGGVFRNVKQLQEIPYAIPDNDELQELLYPPPPCALAVLMRKEHQRVACPDRKGGLRLLSHRGAAVSPRQFECAHPPLPSSATKPSVGARRPPSMRAS
jgi:hypothetical protein